MGLLGGTLACATALTLSGDPTGAQLIRMSSVDGALAMGCALALSLWDKAQAEKNLVAARARAAALQAHINPHFFFNTLNTISAMIPSDPPAAQHTLGLLADMSRYAFATVDGERVSLARELAFARTYLEIEQARFGSRLRYELPESASVEGLSLPALTVQPLIENAVRHGIGKLVKGGAIVVRTRREGPRFLLTVENSSELGSSHPEAAFVLEGHALANIRERLRLHYQGRASLTVSFPRPDTVTVTIEVPIHP
jgi:LytS/YehU family sensor histidine kinase